MTDLRVQPLKDHSVLLGNVAHHAVDGLGLVVPILTLSHLTR